MAHLAATAAVAVGDAQFFVLGEASRVGLRDVREAPVAEPPVSQLIGPGRGAVPGHLAGGGLEVLRGERSAGDAALGVGAGDDLGDPVGVGGELGFGVIGALQPGNVQGVVVDHAVAAVVQGGLGGGCGEGEHEQGRQSRLVVHV